MAAMHGSHHRPARNRQALSRTMRLRHRARHSKYVEDALPETGSDDSELGDCVERVSLPSPSVYHKEGFLVFDLYDDSMEHVYVCVAAVFFVRRLTAKGLVDFVFGLENSVDVQ